MECIKGIEEQITDLQNQGKTVMVLGTEKEIIGIYCCC